MATTKIITADDVLKSFNGNISRAADYLGISAVTMRKHRENGTLASIIIINGSVYIHKHDVTSELPTVHNEDEWERISNADAPRIDERNKHKYRTSIVDGKIVYWRNKNG